MNKSINWPFLWNSGELLTWWSEKHVATQCNQFTWGSTIVSFSQHRIYIKEKSVHKRKDATSAWSYILMLSSFSGSAKLKKHLNSECDFFLHQPVQIWEFAHKCTNTASSIDVNNCIGSTTDSGCLFISLSIMVDKAAGAVLQSIF